MRVRVFSGAGGLGRDLAAWSDAVMNTLHIVKRISAKQCRWGFEMDVWSDAIDIFWVNFGDRSCLFGVSVVSRSFCGSTHSVSCWSGYLGWKGWTITLCSISYPLFGRLLRDCCVCGRRCRGWGRTFECTLCSILYTFLLLKTNHIYIFHL